MDVPVPQVQEQIKMIPQERISGSIWEQTAAPSMEKMLEVIQSGPQERLQECVVEEFMDVFVSPAMEEKDDLVKTFPQERVQNPTPEQTAHLSP